MGLFGDEKGQILPPYKGILSSYAEWHALATGYKHGISELVGRNKNDDVELPTKDAKKEPHMYNLGYSLGTLTRWAFFLALAREGFALY